MNGTIRRVAALRMVIAVLVAALVVPARAEIVVTAAASDQPTAPTDATEAEVQPKFFLFGFLLSVSLKVAVASFREWRRQQASGVAMDGVSYRKLLRNSVFTSLATSAGSAVFPIFAFKGVDAVEGTPPVAAPTRRSPEQPADYRAAHVAVLGFDAAGAPTNMRLLSETYRTGERVKLKALASFDAWLIVESVNSRGERRQIYPRDDRQAVMLRAGAEVLLPLVEDQFLEFAGEPGAEQLVLTFRDPGVLSGSASQAEVVVHEESDGLSLLQETAPGTYAVMTRALTLRHDR